MAEAGGGGNGDPAPWLEGHAGRLGEALGLDIEITGREAACLIGREAGSGRDVLVGGRPGPTGDAGLGGLLARAAALGARIVVWVGGEVRDEHREAIRWLNASDAVAFFAVEATAPRGGGPLPRLRVAAGPAPPARVKGRRPPPATAEGKAYQAFYGDLVDLLRERRFTEARRSSVGTAPSKTFGWGMRGCAVRMAFGEGEFRVQLVVEGGTKQQNKAVFDRLHAEREAIEAALGEAPAWLRLDRLKTSRLEFRRPGSVAASSAAELGELKRWAADLLPLLRDVFGPRVAALNLDALTAEAREA